MGLLFRMAICHLLLITQAIILNISSALVPEGIKTGHFVRVGLVKVLLLLLMTLPHFPELPIHEFLLQPLYFQATLLCLSVLAVVLVHLHYFILVVEFSRELFDGFCTHGIKLCYD